MRRAVIEGKNEPADISRRHANRGGETATVQDGICTGCSFDPVAGANRLYHGGEQLSWQRLAALQATGLSPSLFIATGPAVSTGTGRGCKTFWQCSGELFQGNSFTIRRDESSSDPKKMTQSQTHLVVIPSYNTGAKLVETVKQALDCWQPVWVVMTAAR